MKKQIISLLLTLVMVAGLLPGISLRASAEEAAPVVTYNLWVAGEQFTSDNLIITDENGGTAEYDPGTNSLVLTNFTASASDCAIDYNSDESTGYLHVILEGENVLTAGTTAINCLGSLEITGTGSLTAESNGNTIHSNNNLTISQCTVTLVSANFSAIFVPNGSISMINSTVSATAYDSYTLETYSPISITESTFIASSNETAMNTNDILADYSGGYHWRTERDGRYSQVALHYDGEAYFEIKPYVPEAEDVIVYFDSIWDNTYAICTYDDSSSTVILPQENAEDDTSGLLTFFIPNNTVRITFTNTHVGQPPESTAEGKACTVTVEAPEYGATYYSYNTYPLWIGGEIVKETSLSGDGWSYDPDTHTLTLRDFHLTVDEEAENIEGIYAQDDLTVVLKGNNTITATGLDCDGICAEGVLTIQGDGSLTIESEDDSLYSETEIIIQSGTLDLTSLEQEAIDSVGSLTITGGTITVDADDDAIEASEFITVNGGSLTITGKDDGLDAGGSLTINDGTICIAVRDNALEAEEDLVINGGTIEIIAYKDNDPALVVFGEILLDESIELPEGSTIDTITVTYEDGYTETYRTILDKDGVPLAALTLEVKTGPETTEPEYTVPECDKADNCVLSQFDDIVATEWYHDGIHFCVAEGIMNGMGEGAFAPNENTTRAQLVMMLYRLAGTPPMEGETEPFTDVANTDWFYAPIVWAYKNKVVNGVTATEFAPNASVTREQVATILYRYLGEPEGTGKLEAFPDVADVSSYAVAPLTWAVGEGLITGIAQADGTALLAPTGNATRAQIATILMRHLTK